jgi:hypothetical protein
MERAVLIALAVLLAVAVAALLIALWRRHRGIIGGANSSNGIAGANSSNGIAGANSSNGIAGANSSNGIAGANSSNGIAGGAKKKPVDPLTEDLWFVDQMFDALISEGNLPRDAVRPVDGGRVQYAWLFGAAAAALDRAARAPEAPEEYSLEKDEVLYRGAADCEYSILQAGPALQTTRPLRLVDTGMFYDVCDLEAWLAAGDPAFRRTVTTHAVLGRDVDCAKLAAAVRARGYDGVQFGPGSTFDRLDIWLALDGAAASTLREVAGPKKKAPAPSPPAPFDPRRYSFEKPPALTPLVRLSLMLYDLRLQKHGVAPIEGEFAFPHVFGAAAAALDARRVTAPTAATLKEDSHVFAGSRPRYLWMPPVDECETLRVKRPLRLAEMYALYNAYDMEAWLASRDPSYARGAKSHLPMTRDVNADALLAAARAQGFDGCYAGNGTFFSNRLPVLLLDPADLEHVATGKPVPGKLSLEKSDGTRITR